MEALLTLLLMMIATSLSEVSITVNVDFQIAVGEAERSVEETDNENNILVQQGVDVVDDDSADGMLSMFDAPREHVKTLARVASIELETLKRLSSIEDVEPHRLRASKAVLKLWKQKFDKYCAADDKGVSCSRRAFYRTADGTCNNLKHPTWGAIFAPQLREIPPMYDDGIDAPRRTDRLGDPLPSARQISNVVFRVDGVSPRNNKLTVMVMQWGQFIDHDFVATPVMTGARGASIQCCQRTKIFRPECFPILIPADDPYFTKRCMSLVRSAPVMHSECSPGFREQINQVTSYIDGSGVYGSTETDMMGLRSMKRGLLSTRFENFDEDLLPESSTFGCVRQERGDYCQGAGDARVNVVPSLGWSHSTFLREHNRIARILTSLNPHWSDEATFQETRRIIAAIIQVINYKEYLPTILNKQTMDEYDLHVLKKVYNKKYDSGTNPTIANVFAAAAFRFGHSQITSYQGIYNSKHAFVEKISIEKTYHCPHLAVYEQGMMLAGLGRWLVDDPVPRADGLFEDGTRNKLFMDKNNNSLDLAALNIQRGRDHGLPSYNHWRIHCGLGKASMRDDGSFRLPDHDSVQTAKLQRAYRHVDDIDLYAGAMTETLLEDSSVGPTFACLIGAQFQRLKQGDRFWHETSNRYIRFTKSQLKEIRKVSLARIICSNYRLSEIQPDVFRVVDRDNTRVDCDRLPSIDLTKWTSCRRSYSNGRQRYSSRCSRRG